MAKDDFYLGKSVAKVEWWLSDCELPGLTWARLRVFDDGSADSCFGECDTLYGFEDEEYAGYLLSEDEYIRFTGMDEEDEREYGIKPSDVSPPTWVDRSDQKFKYLGTC
jgi:hypothetical protein